jgi:hypothetical protein
LKKISADQQGGQDLQVATMFRQQLLSDQIVPDQQGDMSSNSKTVAAIASQQGF